MIFFLYVPHLLSDLGEIRRNRSAVYALERRRREGGSFTYGRE